MTLPEKGKHRFGRRDSIPNYPDLRTFDLYGRCRCGRSAREDDVHWPKCPHQKHSKSMVVLEWR